VFPNDAEPGVDTASDGIQVPGPFAMSESLTQTLSGLEVIDAEQSVLIALITNAALVELSRQPLSPVDIDLDLEGKPALHTGMHETKFGVDVVKVVMDTLPETTHDIELVGLFVGLDLKRVSQLQSAQDTDQSLRDSVFLGDALGKIVLVPNGMLKVHVRPAGIFGSLQCVLFDGCRSFLYMAAEVLEQNVLTGQKSLEETWQVKAGQVAVEDHSVDGGELAEDLVFVLGFE
jgi:hypothetical protein